MFKFESETEAKLVKNLANLKNKLKIKLEKFQQVYRF